MNIQVTLKNAVVAGAAALLVIGASAGIGYYKGTHSGPAEINQKVVSDKKLDTHTVGNVAIAQDAVVDKTKNANLEVDKKTTTTTYVQKPNGAKITIVKVDETSTKDKSVEEDKKHTDTDTNASVDQTKHEEDHTKVDTKIINDKAAQYRIAGGAGFNVSKLDFSAIKPIYGISIGRRLIGPFWIEGEADTTKTVMLKLGCEF